jgi:hypothetical protein
MWSKSIVEDHFVGSKCHAEEEHVDSISFAEYHPVTSKSPPEDEFVAS